MNQKTLSLSLLAITFSTCVIAGDIKKPELLNSTYKKAEQKTCQLTTTAGKGPAEIQLTSSINERVAKYPNTLQNNPTQSQPIQKATKDNMRVTK